MIEKKRIMILTADAGFGHRSAANAVKEALKEKYDDRVTVDIVNPLEELTTPTFLRDSQYEYDKWVRYVPELYQLGYQASDAPIPTIVLERSLAVLQIDTMRELFRRYKPDVVLTTYPTYQSAVTTLFTSRKYRVPFYAVVTDLSTVHRFWFHRKIDGCFVPNEHVSELAMNYGLPLNKITITGIPVSPAISREKRTKSQIRKELGWEPDITTVLAVGSKRVERLVDSLNVINHFGGKVQLIVVAGKDEALFRQINQFDWHIPVHIYDYVENMSAFMRASDLLICKAGGLIVTEALASGLPMMLIEIIPGQETGNAEYVTSYGAADMTQSPIEILEQLNHLLRNDHELLNARAKNAQKLGKPLSAYAVADQLIKALDNSEEIKNSHRQPKIVQIVEKIEMNDVWADKKSR